MRIMRALAALACIGLGVVVGALNHQAVVLDLGAVAIPTTFGIAVLGALLLGALAGGLLLAASVVVPLQRRLRRTAAVQTPQPAPPQTQR